MKIYALDCSPAPKKGARVRGWFLRHSISSPAPGWGDKAKH